MTNNIEKLYELAGVKKVGKKHSCKISDFYDCRKRYCDICGKAQDKNYPLFTEFKQLELIKKLARIKPIKITDTSENWYVEPSGYYQMTPSKTFPKP